LINKKVTVTGHSLYTNLNQPFREGGQTREGSDPKNTALLNT